MVVFDLSVGLALSSFWTAGELVGCVQSRELGARGSPSDVYPAGKLSDLLLVVSILVIVYDSHL